MRGSGRGTESEVALASEFAGAGALTAGPEREDAVLQALRELAAATVNRDLGAVAALLVDHTTSLLEADGGTLFAWDAGGQVLRAVYETGSDSMSQPLSPGEGIIGRAFQAGQTLTTEASGHDSRFLGWGATGSRGAIAFPLLAEGRPVGCLGLWRCSDRAFTEEDVQLVSLFAALAAPVLESARTAEVTRREVNSFRSLYEVGVAAGGITDPVALGRLAVEAVRKLLGSDGANLGWWDPASGLLKPYVRSDMRWAQGKEVVPGEGAQGSAFALREPVVIDEYQGWAGAMPEAAARGVRCVAAVPMLVGDRAVGSLAATRYTSRPFSQEDVELLSLLAGLIAPAVEAARLEVVRKQSRRQMDVVLGNAPLLAFTVDREGMFMLVEGRGLDLIGLPNSYFAGRSIYDVYGHGSQLVVAVEQALAGRPHRIEATSAHNGRSWDLILHPLLDDDGEVRGATGIAVDLSERREALLARRESQAKSRFLAAMSHELRTPLNSILGFTQLLSRRSVGELNEKQQRYLGHIASSGEHLLALINDVLDLTRVQAGQVQVNLEPVDVAASVTDALDRLYPIAEAKSIALCQQTSAPLFVMADRRRLQQVLGNLVSNAIKFTDEGGRVTVSAGRSDRAVQIQVVDTGIGIQVEDQERIFEEFTQVESGTTRSHEGTGLGLPLSRQLLELMGGQLSVNSSPGQGSVFTVTMRAAQARREPPS